MEVNKLKNDLINAVAKPFTDKIAARLNNNIKAYQSGLITTSEFIAEVKKANDILRLI